MLDLFGFNLTFEQVVTYIILPVGAAVSATAAFFARKIWPAYRAKLEQKVKQEMTEMESRIEGDRDVREHRQKLDQLRETYLESEASVAQQRLAELLQDLIEFLQKEIRDDQRATTVNISLLPGIADDLKKLNAQFLNVQTYMRTISGMIESFYEDATPIDKDNDRKNRTTTGPDRESGSRD